MDFLGKMTVDKDDMDLDPDAVESRPGQRRSIWLN